MAVNLETGGNAFVYKQTLLGLWCHASLRRCARPLRWSAFSILARECRPLLAKTPQRLILRARLLHVTTSAVIFKGSILLRRWRLGIAGMTAMLLLGTLLWELDGSHWGFQCESAACHSETHSAAEGNVSRTLQVTGTYFCNRSSWRVGPIGKINEFLKEAWFSLHVLC